MSTSLRKKSLRVFFGLVCILSFVASAASAGPGSAGEAGPSGFSVDRMLARARYLAGDELGGRAPGSEGEKLAIEYIANEFKAMGYSPGNPDGTFFQRVPLVGTTTKNEPEFELTGDGVAIRFEYGSDFVAWSPRQRESASVDAELVFVGYGVVAPEYEWNDFKDFDVAGKYIVMLVGDPPHPDATLFGGKAMTYYGRWTYKYEVAAEKGAAGAIVVHTTPEAGYPWEVVANSWSGEQFDISREDEGASRCAIESWITEAVAEKLFAHAGKTFTEARSEAVSRDFRPYSLRLRGAVSIQSKTRSVVSNNVVARLEGNAPGLKDEHVIYTSHWDHLGHGNPVDGDSIYNGALDNASGVAAVLEVANAFSRRREEIKRSVLFLITTAEESGLLGAKHYTENPLYPLAKAVAMINVDGANVWGRTSDMVVVGYGQSDLEDDLLEAVSAQNRTLQPEGEPEKGYYYRSDHFPFAKRGVPALYAHGGTDFVGRPEEWGTEVRERYVRHRYHKPQDEIDEAWDLAGAAEDMEALFHVGLKIVLSDRYPRWRESSEFRLIREEPVGGDD